MARHTNTTAEQRRNGQIETDGSGSKPVDVDQVARRVRQFLEDGQPKKALEAIGRSPVKSPWLVNAAAVCQIRLGNPEEAVQLLRPLVVQGDIHLRSDVPPAFKLSFAAALLAVGNLDGFLATLNEVHADEHPAAGRYHDTYRRWKASLTLWEKLKSSFGGRPSRPFVLDFPPGEVT
jgi:hypothetical protein